MSRAVSPQRWSPVRTADSKAAFSEPVKRPAIPSTTNDSTSTHPRRSAGSIRRKAMVSGVGATLWTGDPPLQATRRASGAKMTHRFMYVSCSVECRGRRSQGVPGLHLSGTNVLASARLG